MLAPAQQLVPSIRMIGAEEAIELCPTLRPEYIGGGLLEPDAMDIDVAAVHQGFLHALRARGGQLRTNREVVGLERSGTGWTVRATGESLSSGVVVDAAGAWCDEIAKAAGVAAVGLTPKRRTAFVFDVPPETDAESWPSVIDSDEEFYFKPESGGLLGSPADATPVAACDVQPEMLDIALAIDRIQCATALQITRVRSKWAGLRDLRPRRCAGCGYGSGSARILLACRPGGIRNHDRSRHGASGRRVDRTPVPPRRPVQTGPFTNGPGTGAPASAVLRSGKTVGTGPCNLLSG